MQLCQLLLGGSLEKSFSSPLCSLALAPCRASGRRTPRSPGGQVGLTDTHLLSLPPLSLFPPKFPDRAILFLSRAPPSPPSLPSSPPSLPSVPVKSKGVAGFAASSASSSAAESNQGGPGSTFSSSTIPPRPPPAALILAGFRPLRSPPAAPSHLTRHRVSSPTLLALPRSPSPLLAAVWSPLVAGVTALRARPRLRPDRPRGRLARAGARPCPRPGLILDRHEAGSLGHQPGPAPAWAGH